MRWTSKDGSSSSILLISSCTRFSPMVRIPHFAARLMVAASTVLVTAQISAPPHLAEALPIFSRQSAMFSSTETLMGFTLFYLISTRWPGWSTPSTVA